VSGRVTTIVATARLRFAPLEAAHAADLFEAFSDPQIYEHIGGGPPISVAELAEQFARRAAGPGSNQARWLNYAVQLQDSGEWIGRLEATIIPQWAEVAYVFGPAYWGRGYAAEAMTALHDHLWKDWSVAECWATTSPHNLRSIRLLRRLGYRACESWPALGSYEPGDLVFCRRTS
jgi:RimJ/RimL family protein N-acetyltransferase